MLLIAFGSDWIQVFQYYFLRKLKIFWRRKVPYHRDKEILQHLPEWFQKWLGQVTTCSVFLFPFSEEKCSQRNSPVPPISVCSIFLTQGLWVTCYFSVQILWANGTEFIPTSDRSWYPVHEVRYVTDLSGCLAEDMSKFCPRDGKQIFVIKKPVTDCIIY